MGAKKMKQRSLEFLLADAKRLQKVREELAKLKEMEKALSSGIKGELELIGRDEVTIDGVMISKSECVMSTVDREKVIEMIGKKKFEQCVNETEYTKLKITNVTM